MLALTVFKTVGSSITYSIFPVTIGFESVLSVVGGLYRKTGLMTLPNRVAISVSGLISAPTLV